MRLLTTAIAALIIGVSATSCNNHETSKGESTPIDSTNINGAAPATYSGNNPANDVDSNRRNNVNDTGTKANTVHNTGYDSAQKH